MSNINIQVDEFNKLTPHEIIEDSRVKEKFIQVWDTLWGQDNKEAGIKAYERESIYFRRYMDDNYKTINAVTRLSIFMSFLDLAVSGLSVEPGVRALCYLQGRSTKVGVNDRGGDLYENRLTLTVSGYGELVLRERCGQIKYADNPVLVYKEDSFSFSDKDGRKSVDYTCNLPHTTVVACFIRIVRNDGSIDYAVMFEEDWMRLSNYSAKQNRYFDRSKNQWIEKGANALYSSNNGGIDTGFLMAKAIKHAFKTYPKLRVGKETVLEADVDTMKEMNMDDIYNVDEQIETKPEPFGETKQAPGVTIDTNEDSGDGAFN